MNTYHDQNCVSRWLYTVLNLIMLANGYSNPAKHVYPVVPIGAQCGDNGHIDLATRCATRDSRWPWSYKVNKVLGTCFGIHLPCRKARWRHNHACCAHYSDVIMGTMASQMIGVPIVCSAVCSGENQRKYQNCASLAFVRGIHRPVDSPHKGPVTHSVTSWCQKQVSMAGTSDYNLQLPGPHNNMDCFTYATRKKGTCLNSFFRITTCGLFYKKS